LGPGVGRPFCSLRNRTKTQLWDPVADRTLAAVRNPVRNQVPADESSDIDRRRFLRGSAATAMGSSVFLGGRLGLGSDGADSRTRLYAVLNRVNTFQADNFFKSGRPWVDVFAYGAKGDGVADDTAAIQAAMDSRTAGGTVMFPAGTYKITAPISIRVNDLHIVGAGRSSILSAGSASASPLLDVSQVRGVMIDMLQLKGQNLAPIGVRMTSPSDGQGEAHNFITRCHIHHFTQAAVRVGDPSGTPTGMGCHIVLCTIQQDIMGQTPNGIELYGPDNMVMDNRINANYGIGIYVASGGQQIHGNHLFTGTVIQAPFPASIKVANGSGIQIIGNYLDSVRQGAAILIAPEKSGQFAARVQIEQNFFLTSGMRNSSDSSDADAVYPVVQSDAANGTVANLIVKGNVGFNNKASGGRWSTIFSKKNGVVDVQLEGNHFYGASGFYDSAPDLESNNRIFDGTAYKTGLMRGTGGVVTKTKSGAITDADFLVPPPDGSMAVDTSGSKLYIRIGGSWKSVVLA